MTPRDPLARPDQESPNVLADGAWIMRDGVLVMTLTEPTKGAPLMNRIAIAAFLVCILAANYVTTEYGMLPVGFGLVATAGTYFAGLTFVLRDSIQDAYGKRATLALIAVGAALSYLVSDPFIALASGVAFLAAETADLAIYTPLRKRGYLRAAIASNVVGALVDTVLFLWVAGFPIADAIAGQMVGKVAVTAIVWAAVLIYRGRRVVIA